MEAYNQSRLKVGFFTILGTAIFVGFLFWVSGGTSSSFLAPERRAYRVPFADVSGLRAGAQVTIAGRGVGRVTDIELNDDYLAVVEMHIDTSVRLYSDAQFYLRQPSLFGAPFIVLDPGGRQAGAQIATSADPGVPVAYDLSASGMEGGLSDAMNEGRDTLALVNRILNEFSRQQSRMQAQMLRLMETTGDLVEKIEQTVDVEQVREIVAGVAELTTTVNDLVTKNEEQLAELVGSMNRLMETSNRELTRGGENVEKLIGAAMATLDEQVGPLLMQMTDTTRALERLVADNDAEVHDLIRSLRVSAENIAAATARVRANPSVLIFGSDEGKEEAEREAKVRVERELSDHGRLPLYGKRNE
jgi:phospholipid/cholesterol/gamma-HCH transport system substrate-binding protein